MKRKSQAAMEFLMTYSWAILIVIVALAALIYFNVINPASLLPERTTFHPPVPNVDNAVVNSATGKVMIAFRNNVGFPINVEAITTPTAGSCGGNGAITVYNNTDSASAPMTINNGDGFRVEFTCIKTLSQDGKFSSDATLTYTNTGSGLTKLHLGSVNGKIS